MRDVISNIIINKILQNEYSAVVDFYLQPIFNLSTFRCVGAEVLMRGVHRQHIVSPGMLLPRVRENEGLIHIGEHIIHHAFSYLRNEILPLKEDFFITINMAAQQLNSETCASHILQLQQQHNIPAAAVIFEITSSEHLLDTVGEENINALCSAGFNVAWDEIDSTQSVMAKMNRFESDYIKLDRDCLKLKNASEAEEVINLAQRYQATVIAEGVETMAQTSMLLKQNVELAQGFLFSRPLKKNEFKKNFLLN